MLPAFGLGAVLTQWEFAPVVTAAVVVAASLYAWGVVRVARRHPARPWPGWRTAMFLGGLAVVVIALESGVGAYDDVLFWDHMIQHLLLVMVAPIMIIAGQPVTLLLHAARNPLHSWVKRVVRSRAARIVTWPPLGFLAYAVMIPAAHLTSLAHEIVVNPVVHDAEHVGFLVVGYLFFLPLLGREPIRWRVSYPVRLLVLALAMPVDTFTGLLLGYQGSVFARGLTIGPRPPGAPLPVEDAHWGGAVMWIGGDAIMFALMMLIVLLWIRDQSDAVTQSGWLERARKASFAERLAATAPAAAPGEAVVPGPERGGIDDDEHLDAYNAYLARLNQRGR